MDIVAVEYIPSPSMFLAALLPVKENGRLMKEKAAN